MPRQTAPSPRFTAHATPGRLQVGGELDVATADVFDEHLRRLGDLAPPGLVVVDLGDVTWISCAGLRPLLDARNRLGHRLLLTHVPPTVVRLLDLTDLTDAFLTSP